MSPQLTRRDLRLLERYQIQRLRRLFSKTLGLCLMKIDLKHTLRVHCPEPWLIDLIIADADRVLSLTRRVLGVHDISLYYAGEEVCRVEKCQAKSVSA